MLISFFSVDNFCHRTFSLLEDGNTPLFNSTPTTTELAGRFWQIAPVVDHCLNRHFCLCHHQFCHSLGLHCHLFQHCHFCQRIFDCPLYIYKHQHCSEDVTHDSLHHHFNPPVHFGDNAPSGVFFVNTDLVDNDPL